MAINAVLTSLLNPLLESMSIFWFVVTISFIVSLITSIVYKYTTNQRMMKELRDDVKRLQADFKKSMKDQQKAMRIQQEMMEKNMKLMSHSMMPTFITLIPLGILFLWLNSSLSFVPLTEGTQFTITVSFDDYVGNAELVAPKGIIVVDNATKPVAEKVDWRISGEKGEYLLEWKVGDKSYTKDVIIDDGKKYSEKIKKVDDGIVKTIEINYKKQQVMNLFGWKLGWLGTYIIFSLIFSMILRKVLKIY